MRERPLLTTMSLLLVAVALVAFAAAGPACAASGQSERARAQQLGAQVAGLDGHIDAAVQQYAGATTALGAVRTEIRRNRRLRALAALQLGVARQQLLLRAVALYKHGDLSAVDALFSAADFQQLVDQLSVARQVSRGDADVVRVVLASQARLQHRSALLTADERTAQRLVQRRGTELSRIRAELAQRRRLLAGAKARQAQHTPAPQPSVAPPAAGGAGGQGAWWPLIQAAASAQGVAARGLYRLMLVESGGSATAVSPTGFCGLFQYARGTWRGSWNPYRGADIFDGAAQIRATALAIHQGRGPGWWGPSYGWAFGD